MDRRSFVALIGSALAAPLARAQQARRSYRVVYAAISPRQANEHFVTALEQGLRDLGYVPGKDVVVEFRSAEGKLERYAEVVQDVVRSKPDVIVTGVNASTTAVRTATQSIPIVMTIGTDVISAGYVKNLAKPGGNVTGITWDVGAGTVVKRLELLKEIAPRISRVAVLWESPYKEQYKPPMDTAAPILGVSTFWHEYSGDPERDFAEMTRSRAESVYVLSGGRMFSRVSEIVALATKHRLATAFPVSEYVASGGLMSYGPNLVGAFRSAARHVDKILKGAKPGDIPVEQPTVIDLTINLKTAKALGLTIPQSVLLRANRVIE
jgi:putative ABC transport system substrate-binding protein